MLTPGEQILTTDWGYQPSGVGAIGDLVFDDKDENGTFNGSDVGISGVTVQLYQDANGNGSIDAGVDPLVGTTTTNGSGNFSFTGLLTGIRYIVNVDTAQSALTSYFGAPFSATTPNPYNVGTLSGTDNAADFGFHKGAIPGPASIGDLVFLDANGNGTYDAGDSPLANVTVRLYAGGGSTLITTAVSGPDGSYLFANLGADSYQVVVDANSAGVPAGYSASVGQYAMTLAGVSDLTADFPFVPLISKSVDKAFAAAGDTLNFGVSVSYIGSELLTDVRVVDPYPAGINAPPTVNQGGTYGAYVPRAGVPGDDAIPGTTSSLNLAATQDTYLRSDQNARNYGSCATVDVRNTRRALLQFSLAAIPAGSLINSAELQLQRTAGQNNATDISAFRTTQSWGEGNKCDANAVAGEATWDSSGTVAWTGGAWVDTSGTAQSTALPYATTTVLGNGAYTWDLGGMAQEWVDGQPNHGVILIQTGADQDKGFDSRTGTTPPVLAVNYTTYTYATNTLTTSASTVATGGTVTVTMTLDATAAYSNVVPSALAVSGGPGSCTAGSPASATVPANTPTAFTWTCTLTGIGEYTFAASAGNGSYTFPTAISPSVLASTDGSTNVVSWNLGSNVAGTAGSTSLSPYVYAFQGNNQQSFWAYSAGNDNWTTFNPADTPAGVTVALGGALTNDGSRYIYALRGNTSKVFLRYDTSTNAWDDAGIADLPAGAANVLAGGALVYLDGNVYAFVGGDSQQFWRYSVSGNSWTQMASTPAGGTVKEGGSLATDGTNIYALRGDNTKVFWRYNVGANTWTVLAPILTNNVKNGGALVYANGAFYALSGNNKQTFFRYNIAANSWTALAVTGTNVKEGGALAYDGTYLYAFMGNGSTQFRRYDIGANSWSAMAAAPAAVTWGGALSFLASGNSTRTSLVAVPTLVKGGGTAVRVAMTLTSNNAIDDVTAGTITVTGSNGANASCGIPTLTSANDDLDGTAGDAVVYEWTCTTSAGADPGSARFSANATAPSPAFTFATATSNSVLITPTLTFSATVASSPPAVIRNTALLANVALTAVPSNTTNTATTTSIGDRVWADTDGDGTQDAGELGLAGVRVYVDSNSNGVYDTGEPNGTTDANGNYRIYGLTAATYTVRADPSTYPQVTLPSSPKPARRDAESQQQYDDADFGLQPPPASDPSGSIGDTVWLDANNDGVKDRERERHPERHASSCTAISTATACSTRAIPWSPPTTTNASGVYGFSGLPIGSGVGSPVKYLVQVDTGEHRDQPLRRGS